MQPACRLHASVSRADSTGLQCVIVGVDAGMQDVDAVHPGVDACMRPACRSHYRLKSSGSAVYVLPRTRTRFGERGFFYSGPAHGTLFLPTFTTLLIPVLSENDSRVYFLIVPRPTTDYCWRSWTCRIAAPYKFRVDSLID